MCPVIIHFRTSNLVMNISSINQSQKADGGERAFDTHPQIALERNIFLTGLIDSDLASLVMAQLIILEAEDPEKDIYLYVNSSGGSVTDGMAIFDIMNQIHPDVWTIGTGFVAGIGSFLLSAGTKGKRISLPSSQIMIYQPLGGAQGQATDIEIQAREILYIKGRLNDLLADRTGQPLANIQEDTERDFCLTPQEAKSYGWIDTVIDLPVRHVSRANHNHTYSQLLRNRIIFLNGKIDSNIANLIMAQLLFLEAEDSEKDIYMYINSPGGSVSAGMAIFDMMNQICSDVCTVSTGFTGGMGAFLLSAGAKGKRMSLPSSRIMICQVTGVPQGQAMNIAVQAKEILYIKPKLNDLLAQHTGQPLEKIQEDTERDFYMSAEEAKNYGLIDIVIGC